MCANWLYLLENLFPEQKVEAIDGPAKAGPAGLPATPMLSVVVIGVLSVSCSAELLLSFSALRNTSTPLLMRTTSSSLTHDQHTQCCWPHSLCVLHALCSAQGNYWGACIIYNSVRTCACAWMFGN